MIGLEKPRVLMIYTIIGFSQDFKNLINSAVLCWFASWELTLNPNTKDMQKHPY
jgi:hypothetical protein